MIVKRRRPASHPLASLTEGERGWLLKAYALALASDSWAGYAGDEEDTGVGVQLYESGHIDVLVFRQGRLGEALTLDPQQGRWVSEQAHRAWKA